MSYKIFAINPGSTSTKIALYMDDEQVFAQNVTHKAEELAQFAEINDQLAYRRDIISAAVEAAGYTLENTDVFAARGGGFQTVVGGTYAVNDIIREHARVGFSAQHPSNLAVQIADDYVKRYGGVAYVVNMPTVDELQDVARVTGFADIYRESRIHALNQKEVGIRYAAAQGRRYEELNLVIAHIGGGISVTAHRKGRMIDSNDIINGDGPMAPTRSGALPAVPFMKLCFSGAFTQRQLYDRITKSGGLVEHLGTSDGREIEQRVKNGDKRTKLIYDAMIYQIAKNIGAMATALKGRVDAILLTGGLAHDRYLVEQIRDQAGYIAPIEVFAGEFEMEALAAGALRVLRGEEEALEYTGKAVWDGFHFDEE